MCRDIGSRLGVGPLDLESLKKFHGGLWAILPDLRIKIDDMVGKDGKVARRITGRGAHRSEFRGVPATGKQVRFGAHDLFELRNGKILRRWTTLDRLGLLIQLGGISAPV